MLPEATEPIIMEECRRCDAKNVRGVSYIMGGVVYEKCSECGREQHAGVLEEVNREQLRQKYEQEYNTEKRDRFYRETNERLLYDYYTMKEEMQREPGKFLEDEVGTVMRQILPHS